MVNFSRHNRTLSGWTGASDSLKEVESMMRMESQAANAEQKLVDLDKPKLTSNQFEHLHDAIEQGVDEFDFDYNLLDPVEVSPGIEEEVLDPDYEEEFLDPDDEYYDYNIDDDVGLSSGLSAEDYYEAHNIFTDEMATTNEVLKDSVTNFYQEGTQSVASGNFADKTYQDFMYSYEDYYEEMLDIEGIV